MKKEKNKNKDEASGAESHKIPQITDMSSRIPGFSDSELAIMLGNAQRLKTAGSAMQRKSAELLLPLMEEEAAKRKAAKGASKKGAVKKKKVAEPKEEREEVEDEL
ncbi:MAG: hypothetical protein SGJ03_05490 [Alphaproteobacteria bacterium]|nr:hypothetical protein [Alphaproteobacteria bacterium]